MYGLKFAGQYADPIKRELQGLIEAWIAWTTVDHNEDGSHNLRPSGFDFVPIGAEMMWHSNTPPPRWLICDGSAVSRTTYQGLFEVIQTTCGAGDGSTTFNLPDYRQRFPLGKAASGTGTVLGSTGGAIDHAHSGGSHSHSIASSGGHSHAVSGSASASGSTSENVEQLTSTGFTVVLHDHVHDVSGSTDSQGDHAHGGSTGSASGSTGAENPPFLSVNFIILAGV